MEILLTLCVAAMGGLLLVKLKVTGGAILGAIMACALLNITTGKAHMPAELTILAKITAGAFIGTKIRKKDLLELKRVVRPTLLLLVSFALYNVLAGHFLAWAAGLDIRTALFATAPGGLAEMTLAGEELGANSSVIAAVQVCRLLSIALILPLILKALLKRMKGKGMAIHGDAQPEEDAEREALLLPRKTRFINAGLTLACAAVGGLLGELSNIPAATISFAVIAASALNVTTGRAYLPLPLRLCLLMLNGAIAGSRITMADIRVLSGLLLPLLLVIAGYMALNVSLGMLICKKGSIGLSTSLFATAPGGMPEMTLMAGELGGDTAKVATMQVTRNVTVVSLFPLLIAALF